MELFHVINRGVDKRITFQDDGDYLRFIQNLFIFNNTDYAPHNIWSTSLRMKIPIEKRLVIIHAYCIMPNHYHLLLSQLTDDGISTFMHKVGMGYTKYFNEKNKRTGILWQGKYKSINITNDSHFNFIPYYVHLNPLDLSNKQWRKGAVKNTQKALAALQNYRWSSHNLFLNPDKIPTSIIKGSFFTKEISVTKYIQEIHNIISDEQIAKYSESIELK